VLFGATAGAAEDDSASAAVKVAAKTATSVAPPRIAGQVRWIPRAGLVDLMCAFLSP
jgi:hypothetical protein